MRRIAGNVHNVQSTHRGEKQNFLSFIKDIAITFSSDEYNETNPLTRDAIKYTSLK